MAGIPNQNNLTKIIKAQVDDLNGVINVVVKAASSKAVIQAQNSLPQLKQYQTIVDTILGKDGVVTMVTNSLMTLTKLAGMKIPKFFHLKRLTKKILKFAADIAEIEFDEKKLAGFKEKLAPIMTVVQNLEELFKTFKKISVPKFIILKIIGIRFALFMITLLSGSLVTTNLLAPVFAASISSLSMLSAVTGMLAKVFGHIAEIKINIMTFVKLKVIPIVIRKMAGIIRALSILGRYIKRQGGLKETIILASVFKMLNSVFTSIEDINAGFLMQRKLRRITKTILLLGKVVRAIARIRIRPKAIRNILILQMLFISLSLVLFSAILVAPIAVLAVPAMLVLMLAIWGFALIVKFIVRVIVKLARRPVVKGLLALMLISMFLTMIALMFMIIATIAEPVVKSIGWILGLLGVIILVTIGLAVFGLIVGALSSVFSVILIGLTLILVVIGIFFLMALMLRMIQALNLDSDKIRENCRIVIETTVMIIADIFKSDEENNEKSDRSWIASVIQFIGGALVTVIQAILAVAYLAVMVVAVLLILVIAGILRLIQELDLKPDKIAENVKVVIETCQMVLDILFGGSDANNKESGKSWIVAVIENFAETYITIIQAIMAVAYLAVMVVAILLIVILAGMLRLLQEIELDPNLIAMNVTTVIENCKMVNTVLFDGPDANNKESGKSWIVSVIENFASGFVAIIQAIMAIAFLAVAIVAILLVQILARQLADLQNIVLDPATISANVTTVVSTCQLVVDSITNRKDKDDDKSKKGWIRKLLEWVGMDSLLMIVDAIMALAWLGFSVAIINLVVMLAQQLAMLGKIQMPTNITKKVDEVVNCANQVVNSVTNRPDPLSGKKSNNKKRKFLEWFLPKKIRDIIDMISRMEWVSSIMSVIGTVQQVAEVLLTVLKIPSVSTVKAKVENICNTADEIAQMVMQKTGVDIEEAGSRLVFLERINKVVRSLTTVNPTGLGRSKTAIGNYMQFIDKINAIDVKKLETSAKMIESMARFSESIRGDFQGLARTLNEDLLPTIEELKKTLQETQTTIKEMAEATERLKEISQRREDAEDSSKTYDDYLAEAEADGKSGAEAQREATRRQSSADKRKGDTVKSMVSEMLDLMNGIGGKVQVSKS